MCSSGVIAAIQQAEAAILAIIAAVGAVVGAVAVLAPRIAQNKADIQAAWDKLRVHEVALNGAVKATEGDHNR
jgi:hypothetical protein